MRITKVRHVLPTDKNQERVVIHWAVAPKEEPDAADKNWDEFSIGNGTPPLKSFADAMQALAADIAKISELPEEAAEDITARSVTFTYHHSVMGASIFGIKALEDSNGFVNLNTPHKPSEAYKDGGDEDNVLDAETTSRLEALIAEAKRYVDGERGVREIKQPSLFDQAQNADENIVRVLPELLTELCESCSPELLANDKFTLVKIEGVPHVVVSTTGNAADGWEEARVSRVVKTTDFDGETFSFQDVPPSQGLHGQLISSGRSKWVIFGELVKVQAEQPAEVPADADADVNWENEFPVRSDAELKAEAELTGEAE